MKAVIEWIVDRNHRPIVVAVAFAPLPLIGPIVTIALLVLVTALWGAQRGLTVAVIAALALSVLVLVVGGNVTVLAGGGALSMLLGVGIGGVLRGTRAFSLTFQVLLLFCLAATGLVTLLGPSPEAMFGPLVDELVELFGESATQPQLDALRAATPMLFGLFAMGVFVQLAVAYIAGAWWLGCVQEGFAFGESFRALRLGRVLGLFGMLWVTLDLAFAALELEVPIVRDLTSTVFAAFLIQGLAVMHAWAHAKSWHPGLITPVYVLLVPIVPPLWLLVVMGLAGTGLMDNIFDLRKPLKA